jgi:hypothetical protein
VGGVLQQQVGKSWKPLAFFLQKAGASRGQVLYLRPRAAGRFRHHPSLQVPVGG